MVVAAHKEGLVGNRSGGNEQGRSEGAVHEGRRSRGGGRDEMRWCAGAGCIDVATGRDAFHHRRGDQYGPENVGHERVAAARRQHAGMFPVLWVVWAVFLLPAPRVGAEFQYAVSSPDLPALARSWSFNKLSLGIKQRLIETPEMHLKKHLNTLKESAIAFTEMTSAKNPHAALPTRVHTEYAAPVTPHETSKLKLSVITVADQNPRRRLFDDDRFSTVTPEPSDSLASVPVHMKSGSLPLSQYAGYADDFNPLSSRRRSVLPDGQTSEFEQDLQQQYLHVQRSIAIGKPFAMTSAICFDFDRTLSKDHVHDMTQASRMGLTEEEAVKAFGGRRRIQKLASFLTELEAAGAAIHIISLGHKSDIMASLSSVGLDGLFPPNRIIGCDELRHLQLVTKAQCTAHVASLCGLRRQDVLLVDDDHEQLLECSESSESELPAAYGRDAGALDEGTCGTYWVKSGIGLTDRDMAAIGGMARSRQMALMNA